MDSWQKLRSRVLSGSKFIERLRKRAVNHPFIFLFILTFAISSGVVATTAAYYLAADYYNSSIGWKNHEQTVISKIGPSVTIDYLKSVLGPPIHEEGGDKYRESIFKRRGYWVQAVSDNKFSDVKLLSVTVCNPGFRPKLKLPGEGYIEMNKDTMASVGATGLKPHYFIAGTTENGYLIDEYYLGNPGGYETLYAGVVDACGDSAWNSFYDVVEKNSVRPIQNLNDPGDSVKEQNSSIQDMRKKVKINTVALTAPYVTIEQLRPNFLIGVDRKVIRVLPVYREIE